MSIFGIIANSHLTEIANQVTGLVVGAMPNNSVTQKAIDGSFTPTTVTSFTDYTITDGSIVNASSTTSISTPTYGGYSHTSWIPTANLPDSVTIPISNISGYQNIVITKSNGTYTGWGYSNLPSSCVTNNGDGTATVNINYLKNSTLATSIAFNFITGTGYIKYTTNNQRKSIDWLTLKAENIPNGIITEDMLLPTYDDLASLIGDYYVVVGKELNFYHDCVVRDNGTKNYYLQYTYTGDNGNRYNDRFSIIPSTTGNFILTVDIVEVKNGVTVVKSTKTVNVHCITNITIPNKKVMFLGDSRIAGQYISQEFGTLCGNNVTFLGTVLGSGGVNREGRAGWQAVHYCNTQSFNGSTNAFYNASFSETKYGITSHFDFANYMSNQGYTSVDYVFIMLGANDGFNDVAINAIKIISENIHAYNANTKIMLIGEYISPYKNVQYNNAFVRRLIQFSYFDKYLTTFASYPYVTVIPTNITISSEYDFPTTALPISQRNTDTKNIVTDVVHLVPTGYYKIADACYSYFVKTLS